MQPELSKAHRDAAAPMPSPPSDLMGKRVLVVEDEGITQIQIRKALTRAGLVVVGSAGSGPEGVALALQEQPDIVLMDIRMPGEYDDLEAARRILTTRAVCIVMLTAFTGSEHRDQAQEIGVSGYVVKPVTTAGLLPDVLDAWQNFTGQTEHSAALGLPASSSASAPFNFPADDAPDDKSAG